MNSVFVSVAERCRQKNKISSWKWHGVPSCACANHTEVEKNSLASAFLSNVVATYAMFHTESIVSSSSSDSTPFLLHVSADVAPAAGASSQLILHATKKTALPLPDNSTEGQFSLPHSPSAPANKSCRTYE